MKYLWRVSILHLDYVTPLAGVWIEIEELKSPLNAKSVTPLAGVWIEIVHAIPDISGFGVTPLAGVWIEILSLQALSQILQSLPSRECGLKFLLLAPLLPQALRHSPRGSVD